MTKCGGGCIKFGIGRCVGGGNNSEGGIGGGGPVGRIPEMGGGGMLVKPLVMGGGGKSKAEKLPGGGICGIGGLTGRNLWMFCSYHFS